MMSSILPMRKMPENVQVTQESFYLPSRTTSKNKALIWTHKKGHESAQNLTNGGFSHIIQENATLQACHVSSSVWGGKRRERLFQTTGRKESKPSSQTQISQSRLCIHEPILSRPEEWVFVFLM